MKRYWRKITALIPPKAMPLLRISRLLAPFLILVGLSTTAFAKPPKVGVAVSAVINASPELGELVSEAVGDALEAKLVVRAVAGARSQALLPASARDESCLGDSACLVAAGKAMKVHELLMLVVVGLGENLKVEATWIDVSSGETALRSAIDIPKDPMRMSDVLEAKASMLIPSAEPRKSVAPPTESPTESDIKLTSDDSDPNSTDVSKDESGSKKSNMILPLAIGGGIAVLVGSSYGISRRVECGGFFECKPGVEQNLALDASMDILAGLGYVAIGVAAYLHFSDDEDSAEESQVGVLLTGETVGLSLGGSF